MRRILLVMSVAALMVAMMMASALPAFATHSSIPHHQHFLTTGAREQVEVGPSICTNSQTGTGFDNVHENVHFGTPDEESPVGERERERAPLRKAAPHRTDGRLLSHTVARGRRSPRPHDLPRDLCLGTAPKIQYNLSEVRFCVLLTDGAREVRFEWAAAEVRDPF